MGALTRNRRRFFRPAPRPKAYHDQAHSEQAFDGQADDVADEEVWGPTEAQPTDAVGLDDLAFDAFDDPEWAEEQRAPSLPIILFSAASGVAGGVIALFISYRWLQWGVELSAGLATLALLLSLGISGAILSAATGSRAAPVNILFSCGLILLAIFLLALCLLVGALFSTLLFSL